MTIRHMRIFLAVYRQMSVTRAAETLHMAQPAVTRAIQELERYYGVRLFERLGRGISATECAHEMYGYAVHIEDAFAEMERRLLNWDASGVLRVGATMTIGSCDLPRIVSRFQAREPGMRVRARVASAMQLSRALMSNELDLALIEGAPPSPELCAQAFGGDRLTLIVPLDSDMPERVPLEDVLRKPLLLREPGSAGRAAVDRLLEEHDCAVSPAWESASTQALVRAVEAGLGVAILPDQLVRGAIECGQVRERAISDVHLERSFNIVWHRHKYLTPAARRFMEMCAGEERTRL